METQNSGKDYSTRENNIATMIAAFNGEATQYEGYWLGDWRDETGGIVSVAGSIAKGIRVRIKPPETDRLSPTDK